MEQATIPRGAAIEAPHTEPPPGSKAPSLLQALRYARDPLGFLIQLQRRYGDIFSLSFPFFGRLYYVADPGLSPAPLPRRAGPGLRRTDPRDDPQADGDLAGG